MGEIGPVLYSASNKLKTLLSSPIKGYGRALMSVVGHLFGAHKFDELNEMYKYALKVSLITTVAVRVPIAYGISYMTRTAELPFGRSECIQISLLCSWVLGAILTIVFYKIGKWKTKAIK
jgi:Na+-driven multidrug efflux pump